MQFSNENLEGLFGIELIFLVVVGIMLYFRLVTKTVLISHQYLSCC